MKLAITFALLFSLILAGCLNFGGNGNSVQWDTYENSAAGISFEKPANWTVQPDEQALIRVGKAGEASFAVILAPNVNASDFGPLAQSSFDTLNQTPGLSNVHRASLTVADFQAVEISADQPAVENNTPITVATFLYVVRDNSNNRLLYLSFLYPKNKPENEAVKQRIIASLKIKQL